MENRVSPFTSGAYAKFPLGERVLHHIKKRVHGPFFCEERTVNSEAYLMRQNWLTELLIEGERINFIFLQNGAPPHWSLIVRQYLTAILNDRWIGRAGNDNCVLLHWSP